MNISKIEYKFAYDKDDDRWQILAHGGRDLDSTFKVSFAFLSLMVTTHVMPLIEQLGGESNMCIFLNLDYHKKRIQEWTLDLSPKGSKVSSGKTNSDPTLTADMSIEDFLSLMSGAENAQTMFMKGKLNIKGNIALALKIQAIIEQQVNNLKSML